MRLVNRQPWYPQRRGWAQVRTPRSLVSRQRREAPEEQLGAPLPLRSKLRLRQGAISNENAALALAWRRARFQGIEFVKASGGEVGGRKHTHPVQQIYGDFGIGLEETRRRLLS